MRRPGTDPDNVQVTDVLCDFCRREWTEEVPMLEGHQGSCICGRCLSVAYDEVVLQDADNAPDEFTCPMCLEAGADRVSLDRAGEAGWRSPLGEGAVICLRCIGLAADALEKDKTFPWRRPVKDA